MDFDLDIERKLERTSLRQRLVGAVFVGVLVLVLLTHERVPVEPCETQLVSAYTAVLIALWCYLFFKLHMRLDGPSRVNLRTIIEHYIAAISPRQRKSSLELLLNILYSMAGATALIVLLEYALQYGGFTLLSC